jgi:tetratricopeptide (TPR) repeat protein
MSKRLEVIQKMMAAGNRDAFTRYAFAMELKGLGRNDEALAAFVELRDADPAYVAQYLMAGGVAEALGKKDDARTWYEQGIEKARAKGDSHALSELQTALDTISAR